MYWHSSLCGIIVLIYILLVLRPIIDFISYHEYGGNIPAKALEQSAAEELVSSVKDFLLFHLTIFEHLQEHCAHGLL